MLPNEIADFIKRAPRKFKFDGSRIVYATHARLVWLAEIARGTIDQRINRRSGIQDDFKPFYYPIGSAIRRNQRNQLRKQGLRAINH